MILNNATILINDELVKKDIEIEDGIIKRIADKLSIDKDLSGYTIIPALVDPHVHLREPGFTQKETIENGSRSCAKGGYTDVFMMPNLNPTPSDKESLKPLKKALEKSLIRCHIIGSITKNEASIELSQFEEIKDECVGFSDDGKGVKTANLMYEAMLRCQKINKPIIAHVEDESLLYGGCIREGKYNKEHNLKGILSISETAQLARDLVLAKETKVQYHMCHISSKDSLELIKFYKKLAKVTVEVSPHHILLNENDLKDDGDYKMNPPLASKEDQEALIEGVLDGSIDCIATDHAPHTNEEKARGLEKSAFGIVGIENSFALMYTNFVETNKMTLKKLVDLMSINVSKIFGISSHEIKIGNKANLAVIDLNKEYVISKSDLISKGQSMPFEGYKVKGKIKYTIMDGEIIYGV